MERQSMNILTYTADKESRNVILTCSDGRMALIDNWNDLAAFLLVKCDMALVHNIDHFVTAIAEILPKSLRESLLSGGRHYHPDNTKLYYQPGRMFGINYVNDISFYGLSRYSEDRNYTASELYALANAVFEAYSVFGIVPKSLTSPVAVYGEALANLKFPRACDLPESAYGMLEASETVMTNEWRELYQIGHWDKDEVWDYDQSSAYPSIIARLPDLTNAMFYETTKEVQIPKSWYRLWGLLKGKLTLNKHVHPFTDNQEYLTTDQLWLLKRYDIGDFQIEHGYYCTYSRKSTLPDLYWTMNTLYNARSNPNSLVSKIAKGISVGVYGRFAQRYEDGKLGADFNSIYALMTTSRCGVKVCDFIYRNQAENDVISVLVDGTLLTKKIECPDSGMGTWKRNEDNPALVASLLYQWTADKHPNGLKYDEMMQLIKAKPNLSCYGDIDLNLLEHNRQFPQLPKTGKDLLSNKYRSI